MARYDPFEASIFDGIEKLIRLRAGLFLLFLATIHYYIQSTKLVLFNFLHFLVIVAETCDGDRPKNSRILTVGR